MYFANRYLSPIFPVVETRRVVNHTNHIGDPMTYAIIKKAASLVFAMTLATPALASGWNCTDEDGYKVQLYNHLDATRTPAVFVVSGDEIGTLLVARDEAISKTTLSRGTRYYAKSSPTDAMSGTAMFWVDYVEGRDAPLADGDQVAGKLVLRYDGEPGVPSDLTCVRYLKN